MKFCQDRQGVDCRDSFSPAVIFAGEILEIPSEEQQMRVEILPYAGQLL